MFRSKQKTKLQGLRSFTYLSTFTIVSQFRVEISLMTELLSFR